MRFVMSSLTLGETSIPFADGSTFRNSGVGMRFAPRARSSNKPGAALFKGAGFEVPLYRNANRPTVIPNEASGRFFFLPHFL
jgi:hypothetical protein